jgi:uncharacterized protein
VRDPTANFDFLVLPGLGNSGVDHWQSYWCMAFRNATRVLQDEWDNRPDAPAATRDFLPIPRQRFPVPTLVVAPTDDTFVKPARAREFAGSWGADYCELPEVGHINSVSRLDTWPHGLLLLGRLIERTEA